MDWIKLNNTMRNYINIIENTKNIKGYSGYLLEENNRAYLLQHLKPKYPKVLAHHVTYKFKVTEDEVPNTPDTSFIIGYAEEDGLEAYVIEIDRTIYRPDNSFFHITWSLDPSKGKKPKDSNILLKKGWNNINKISIKLIPHFFKFAK